MTLPLRIAHPYLEGPYHLLQRWRTTVASMTLDADFELYGNMSCQVVTIHAVIKVI